MREPDSERTQKATPRPGTDPPVDTGGGRPGDSTGPWAEPGAPREDVPRIGRYEVRGSLGRGACGAVYRAFDPELGREVAVKVPQSDWLGPDGRERFVREARAAAKVHHPNVCPIHDVGTDGELPFLVMHLVPGGTLAGVLAGGARPLPVRDAVVYARDLAFGVAAAHAEGVIHRDLKPGNVLWDAAARRVMVTDFGLARMGNDAAGTGQGVVVGTPLYMSPEQARGRTAEVGPLSDVYSLGVIFYELLTGQTPYRGESSLDVMIQACAGNPKPPSAVRTGLDPALDKLCLKAMAVSPADRFPSAQAFAAALDEYLLELDADTPGGSRRRKPVAAEWGQLLDGLRLAWVGMAALAVVAVTHTVGQMAYAVRATSVKSEPYARNYGLWGVLTAGELAALAVVAAGRWRCRLGFPGAGAAGWSGRATAALVLVWGVGRVVQVVTRGPPPAADEVEPPWERIATAGVLGAGVALAAASEGMFGLFAVRVGRLVDASWLRVTGRVVSLGAVGAVLLILPAAVLYAVFPSKTPAGQVNTPLITALVLGSCCGGPLLAGLALCVFVQTFAAVGEVRALSRAARAPARGLFPSLLSVLPASPPLRWAGVASVLLYPVAVAAAFYLSWPAPPPSGSPSPTSGSVSHPVPSPTDGPAPVPLAPITTPAPPVDTPGIPTPPPEQVAYRTLSGLSGTVSAVAYSADGKYVAGGCGAFYSPLSLFSPPTAPGTLAVWDANGGAKPLWSKSATDQGDKCSVGDVVFTRGGERVWAGYTADRGLDFSGRTRGRVYAWDWKRDDLVHRRDGELAAVDPDEKVVVVTHYLNGTVRWLRGSDMADAGYCIGPKSASGSYPQRVNLVALDPPRGRAAVSWGYEKAQPALGAATIRVGTGAADATTPAVIESGGDGHLAFAFARDGRLILLGRDGQVATWDGSGPPRKRFQTDVDPNAYNRLRVSPNGTLVALPSRNGFVCLWDLETGRKSTTIDTGAAGRPWSFEFRPDGGELAIGTERGTIVLWPLR